MSALVLKLPTPDVPEESRCEIPGNDKLAERLISAASMVASLDEAGVEVLSVEIGARITTLHLFGVPGLLALNRAHAVEILEAGERRRVYRAVMEGFVLEWPAP